ncbi:hypothetical protein HGRIS_001137 [Hohenbuehelia grisea]|uniref:Uncharacterized protein n=1 Tax=Hohenbuehelia grisea TaxID=104357 RepID=A0ABR3JND3_9AGAR
MYTVLSFCSHHTEIVAQLVPGPRSQSSNTYSLLSNPLDNAQPSGSNQAETRAPDTVNAWTDYYETQAALRPLTEGVRTTEELEAIVKALKSLRDEQLTAAQQETIRGPTLIITKAGCGLNDSLEHW